MARAVIGLGANLGRSERTIDRALRRLDQLDGVAVQAASHVMRSDAIGPQPQDTYANAVALLETRHDPLGLLAALQQLEHELGRRRDPSQKRWGPRPIDLDVLLMDDVVIDEPQLTIPHPWMLVRRFALAPAAEIAPEMIHPLVARPLSQLLAAADGGRYFAICGGEPRQRAELAIAACEAIEAEGRRIVPLQDPRPELPPGEASAPRLAALKDAGESPFAAAGFFVPEDSPRFIVLLDSRRDIYRGVRSEAAHAALDAGCGVLILDRGMPLAAAAECCVYAWLGL